MQASMFIGSISCSGKCCAESGLPPETCQNHEWHSAPVLDMPNRSIIERYLSNPLTSAIVFGGLEPFEQADELIDFIRTFRDEYGRGDPVVIYTGYYPEEVDDHLFTLTQWDNIIVKFGRYKPNRKPRYDDLLGVWLASDNQFASTLSSEAPHACARRL
jgi:pyruvate-formate lyase-activating enzyme